VCIKDVRVSSTTTLIVLLAMLLVSCAGKIPESRTIGFELPDQTYSDFSTQWNSSKTTMLEVFAQNQAASEGVYSLRLQLAVYHQGDTSLIDMRDSAVSVRVGPVELAHVYGSPVGYMKSNTKMKLEAFAIQTDSLAHLPEDSLQISVDFGDLVVIGGQVIPFEPIVATDPYLIELHRRLNGRDSTHLK